MGGCASKNKYTVDADEAKDKDKKKEKKTKDKGKKKGDEKDEKHEVTAAENAAGEDKKDKSDDGDKTKENGGPPKDEDKIEATKTDDVHLSPREKFFMEKPTNTSTHATKHTFPDLLAKSPGVTVTTSTSHRVEKGDGDKPDVNVVTTTTRRVGEEDGKRIDATGTKEEAASENKETKTETITLPDGRTMEVTKMTTTSVKSESNVVRKKTTYVEAMDPDEEISDEPKVTVKKETVITRIQSHGDPGDDPQVHTHTESHVEEVVLPEVEKEVESAKVEEEVKEEVVVKEEEVQQEAAPEVAAAPTEDAPAIVAETVEVVESRPRSHSHSSSSSSSDSSDDEEKKKEVEVPENFLEQFRENHKLTAVEFMRTWKHYDKDRSGYLEGKELRKFLTDLLESKDEKTDKKTIKRYGKYMMKEFDFNKDSKIDITELSQILPVEDNFLNKFPARITRTPEELDEIFKHYDEDGSGTIGGIELLALLRDMFTREHQAITDAQLNEYADLLRQLYDIEGDGKLRKEDLRMILVKT